MNRKEEHILIRMGNAECMRKNKRMLRWRERVNFMYISFAVVLL
jgi:hypothetical protein